MRAVVEPNIKDSVASLGIGGKREDEKKVRFDTGQSQSTVQKSVDLKGKKYEGFSSLQQKGILVKKAERETKKDIKLDEEFIHNLHQHIYYLEMQLKLLYYF
jgi:hypothetical protein